MAGVVAAVGDLEGGGVVVEALDLLLGRAVVLLLVGASVVTPRPPPKINNVMIGSYIKKFMYIGLDLSGFL